MSSFMVGAQDGARHPNSKCRRDAAVAALGFSGSSLCVRVPCGRLSLLG